MEVTTILTLGYLGLRALGLGFRASFGADGLGFRV